MGDYVVMVDCALSPDHLIAKLVQLQDAVNAAGGHWLDSKTYRHTSECDGIGKARVYGARVLLRLPIDAADRVLNHTWLRVAPGYENVPPMAAD